MLSLPFNDSPELFWLSQVLTVLEAITAKLSPKRSNSKFINKTQMECLTNVKSFAELPSKLNVYELLSHNFCFIGLAKQNRNLFKYPLGYKHCLGIVRLNDHMNIALNFFLFFYFHFVQNNMRGVSVFHQSYFILICLIGQQSCYDCKNNTLL